MCMLKGEKENGIYIVSKVINNAFHKIQCS